MQRATFSRARKILGIRILPRAPTLQTYLFWPIGVNQRRELAQYSSCTAPIPDFFGAAAMQRHTFSRARKKTRILSGCQINPFAAKEISQQDPEQESKSELWVGAGSR